MEDLATPLNEALHSLAALISAIGTRAVADAYPSQAHDVLVTWATLQIPAEA